MKKLTKEQFNKAAAYMKTDAEKIDRAMFEYIFENKPMDEVSDVLQSYQNEDGGFGMLDYDIGCPVSCLKTTESACRYIFAMENIPADHPMIHKMISYIVANFNCETGEWNNHTVPEVNDYPHAPWWEHEECEPFVPENHAEMLEHYDLNTNAALAGMLVKYSSLVPGSILELAMGIVIEKIKFGEKGNEYAMNSSIFFVNALADKTLKADLLDKLMGDGKLVSLLGKFGWCTEDAYKMCLWFDSPEHPYYNLYRDSIEDNLDKLINNQQEDGSWLPNWHYGEPEAWAEIVKRLKGVLTMRFLWTLKNFGRIEM